LPKLLISAGTVHVRVKMEDAGIIMGSSLVLDYDKLGYSFIAYVGVFLIILLRLNSFCNASMRFHFVTCILPEESIFHKMQTC
jgi:DNA-binding Lrp family transcriptional regulator